MEAFRDADKMAFDVRQLTARTARCRITTIESSSFITSAIPAESEDKLLRGLQECWRSALRWLTSIPATMGLVAEGVGRLAGVLAKVLSAASLYKVQGGPSKGS